MKNEPLVGRKRDDPVDISDEDDPEPETHKKSKKNKTIEKEPELSEGDDRADVAEEAEDNLEETEFVPPATISEWRHLSKKIEDVEELPPIDLHATAEPEVLAGRGILKRICHFPFMEQEIDSPRSHIEARVGLAMSEVSSWVRILSHQCGEARKEEKKWRKHAAELESTETAARVQAAEEIARAKEEAAQSVVELAQSKAEAAKRTVELPRSEARVASLERELEKARSVYATNLEKLAEKTVADFMESDKYKEALADAAAPLYACSRDHVLRMAAAQGIPPGDLFRWAATPPFDEIAHKFHKLVPFQSDELEIYAAEVAKGTQPAWIPDSPAPNSLFAALARLDEGDKAEYPTEEIVDAQPLASRSADDVDASPVDARSSG